MKIFIDVGAQVSLNGNVELRLKHTPEATSKKKLKAQILWWADVKRKWNEKHVDKC